jgi:1,2-diacylglycerol 3-alpha-glucosyltransferase
MKIIILADAYFEDTVYQVNNFVKYYLKDGHKVVVICSTIKNIFNFYNDVYDKNTPEDTKEIGNLKIIRLKYSLNILFKIRKFRNINQILSVEQPDLIFVQDIHFNLHDACKYKLNHNKNCRIIMNFHADFSNSASNILSYYLLHKFIRNLYLNINLKHIDKIFPIIDKSKLFLIKMYSIPESKLEILPIGVDTDLFFKYKDSDNINRLKTQLGIPSDGIVVFSGGKIEEFKKSDIILHAFNSLLNKKIFLIIVGKIVDKDPLFSDNYKKLISENKNVIFLGWKNQDELYSYMSICDIALFPSSQTVLWQYSIGMGMVLIAGKHLEYKNGKTFEQDLDYLNLNNNVIVLDKNASYVNQIIDILNDLSSNVDKLELMKAGAKKTTSDFLDFNKLIKKTFNN